MRPVLIFFSLCVVVVFTAANFGGRTSMDEGDRKSLWEKVKAADNQRLPKTSMKLLDEIYQSALQDSAYPEAIKAMCQRIRTEASINQPANVFAINALIAESKKVPKSIGPLTNAILANWMFQYYQQNRWRFQNRSQTAAAASDDFQTWDRQRILDEVDRYFQLALADDDQLKNSKVEDFGLLLVEGNISDAHRPTLYDFVANEAIQFYQLDEQIIRQIDGFQVTADSPAFATTDEFIRWSPPTTDQDSFALKAVRLYQDLLKFHQGDDDQTAFLDTDLNRILFANQTVVGGEKQARYRAALKRFSDLHTKHPLSSKALAHAAEDYRLENELVQARQTATIGMNRFPKSIGGRRCFNLIQEIESPSLSIQTEVTWNEAEPQFVGRYKNLSQVYFRLVPFDFDGWKFGRGDFAGGISRRDRDAVARLKPIKSWSVKLPPTDDYQIRSHEFKAQLDIKKGAYLLIASTDRSFKSAGNFLLAERIWRTNLAHVGRTDSRSTELSGQLFNAMTGQPIADAKIEVDQWVRDGRNSKVVELGSVTTNQDGIYSIQGQQRGRYRITVSHQGDQFGWVDSQYRFIQDQGDSVKKAIHLFTDRSIYRPGQTIHFKGICTNSDRQNNRYSAVANKRIDLELVDVNGQVVETIKTKTNSFGSISGTLTAPRGRATGRMTLRAVYDRYPGVTSIRVEEYKRPKFQVEIEKPDQAYALNESVKVKGVATSYTGAPIDGAKVSYRVVRTVNYPSWWYWRCWWAPVTTASQEITNGVTTTGTDGSFEVAFTAKPDLSADREGQPTFRFQITADVTDTSGETRSDQQSVTVGFTSMQANIAHQDWLTAGEPVEFKISTSTLDGVPQAVDGSLKIFRLTPPDEVQPKSLENRWQRFSVRREDAKADLSDYLQWPQGEEVFQQAVNTDQAGQATHQVPLKSGAFKAVFESTDPNGQPFSTEAAFLVIDPSADQFAIKIPDFFAAKKNSWQPGETFEAVWGSGYQKSVAYVEVYHRQKRIQAFWTNANTNQHQLKIPITESHRGGLNVLITHVRDNRLYTHRHQINVPWSNKQLKIKWEHFVSKLEPGGKQTWSAVISGPQEKLAEIEMMAAMYDKSLDQFLDHRWHAYLGQFYSDSLLLGLDFSNHLQTLDSVGRPPRITRKPVQSNYRSFARELSAQLRRLVKGKMSRSEGAPMPATMAAPQDEDASKSEGLASPAFAKKSAEFAGEPGQSSGPDLSQISIRKNLQETAFFFPNLRATEDGQVKIEFEVPEALTTWKFMGLAHDRDLRSGLLIDEIVTRKDLMVQPNPPRFLREGDQLYFSVKVVNQSEQRQTGKVELRLKNAFDDRPIDESFGNVDFRKDFDIPAKESRSYHWKLTVPDFVGAITYTAVGGNDSVSDGEEGFVPVLSKRILVTESLPLPIRGQQNRTFTFEPLQKIATSDSIRAPKVTVQMTSNPSWYAVMALPYLMEYPHQCSEQTFNRLYANALAHHIAGSNPRIRRIFDQWKTTDALVSPLEKNEDLRNVLIAESPWLIDGKNESQARRNVGLLFDNNKLNREIRSAADRLKAMQHSDGAWPWFAGGRANDYLTIYIATGFGRLRNLGVDVESDLALKAIDRMDFWLKSNYDRIARNDRLEKNNLSYTIAFYLYGRTFFLKDRAVSKQNQVAFDYFIKQSQQYWTQLGSRQSQAHIAIAMKRLKKDATASEIMASITERSLSDDEFGQFWREASDNWFWYQAPIETQALMIEAYDEVLGDQERVEACKVWLLKQKQTQNWKTTKSTADAVYALLLRGSDPLASTSLVKVSVAGDQIKPDKIEAGTGFYEKRFSGSDVKAEMKTIEVSKSDDGVAWGSVHFQYLEDVSKFEPYEGTPLTMKKGLFAKKNSPSGPTLIAVDGPVEVGDELVARIEIRVDRAMEYVHLKDYRGSGTEPVNVLSQYKSQDGLWYYESTKDTATHFFIDYLPRGTYVFEYSVRVQHKGIYQTGIAELQCMYAPEFNSHSGSVSLEVK